MHRKLFQVLILFLLASFCLSGFLLGRHLLRLPFRSTNDALHKRESAFNLDFLIPSGVHLDDKITIGEVIKTRISKGKPFYERVLRAFFDLIPSQYRHLADLFLFFFWVFCFMTFLRVFTFMGYARTLRGSLFIGGLTYYFMPDFSPGKGDDLFFIGFPLLIIFLRTYMVRRKKRRRLFKVDPRDQ